MADFITAMIAANRGKRVYRNAWVKQRGLSTLIDYVYRHPTQDGFYFQDNTDWDAREKAYRAGIDDIVASDWMAEGEDLDAS